MFKAVECILLSYTTTKSNEHRGPLLSPVRGYVEAYLHAGLDIWDIGSAFCTAMQPTRLTWFLMGFHGYDHRLDYKVATRNTYGQANNGVSGNWIEGSLGKALRNGMLDNSSRDEL